MKEVQRAQVGKKAPDFSAMAVSNNQFSEINLTDYQGRWKILYFYSAAFTFV